MDAQKLCSLTVLNNLLDDKIIDGYRRAVESGYSLSALGKLYSAILKCGAEDGLALYMSLAVKKDKNIFSKKASLGLIPSQKLTTAFIRDLSIIYSAVQGIVDTFKKFMPELEVELGKSDGAFCENWANQKTADSLADFYKSNGCGEFAFNTAFKADGNGLTPLRTISQITLDDLKEYVEEKRVISHNIEAFLKDKPYANMLFYGDKGTGKSSTVHAMLSNYAAHGLRLVELPKTNIPAIGSVLSLLPPKPLKFIIFIDDLSLSDKDESFTVLKAALEGSVEGLSKNIMFVATSNRRHIVSESFEDRENNIHLSDTIAEQLSLSDRFGLTVLFDTPDKKLYLKIIYQLLTDAKIDFDEENITKAAEKWALRNGGRSPRRARQFVNALLSGGEI